MSIPSLFLTQHGRAQPLYVSNLEFFGIVLDVYRFVGVGGLLQQGFLVFVHDVALLCLGLGRECQCWFTRA